MSEAAQPPKKSKKTPLLVAIGIIAVVLVLIGSLVFVFVDSSTFTDSDDHPRAEQSTAAASVKDSTTPLTDAPAARLRDALPAESDFPDAWQVQAQNSRPAALPGLNGTNTELSAVTPEQCLDFAGSLISVPGASIPGDFLAAVIAKAPSVSPRANTAVFVIATRKAGEWGNPSKIRDSLATCSDVTAEISFTGKTASTAITSTPIDTSAVKADAAGRSTIVKVGDQAIRLAVVRAQVRGVLVSASSQVSPGSQDDQSALLVKLVQRTVDRLNAL